uniref:J domain-containing protein n=1 Tax=Oryza brachyantha TaxID=4533 RepID=J3MJ64_ORYBR
MATMTTTRAGKKPNSSPIAVHEIQQTPGVVCKTDLNDWISILFEHPIRKATPLIAGLAVAAAALAGRYSIQAWNAYKARPVVPRLRKFYEGGFQPTMTRREAGLILGVRENAHPEKVKEAHKKVMVANHPDAGGSHYLASKINEAKDILLGKTKGGGEMVNFGIYSLRTERVDSFPELFGLEMGWDGMDSIWKMNIPLRSENNLSTKIDLTEPIYLG